MTPEDRRAALARLLAALLVADARRQTSQEAA